MLTKALEDFNSWTYSKRKFLENSEIVHKCSSSINFNKMFNVPFHCDPLLYLIISAELPTLYLLHVDLLYVSESCQGVNVFALELNFKLF